MSGSVHQSTKVRLGSYTRVTNTYPRKRGRIENLPLNGSVKFEKGFDRTDLKQRIARLKSSSAYRRGKTEAEAQLRKIKTITLRKGKAIKVKSGNLRVNVSTS